MEYGHLYCTDPSNAEWLKNISFTVFHATSDPLVNVYRSMGNQHIQWVNQRTEWQFSIAKYEFTQGIFFSKQGSSGNGISHTYPVWKQAHCAIGFVDEP